MHRKYSCVECKTPVRQMSGEIASQLYLKLKPFLEDLSSWRYYLPKRNGCVYPKESKHSDFSLHSWDGPGTFPKI